MDHVSLQFFMANINKIADGPTRCLIWYNISSLVRQTIVSVSEFSTMIQVHLFDEPSNFVLKAMLGQLLGYVLEYSAEDLAVQIQTEIFDKIYNVLKNSGFT